jgi:hypothetical protein
MVIMDSLVLVSSIGTQVNLLGSNAHEVAIVDQWVHFAEHEISAPTQNITGLIYGFYKPFNLEARTKFTAYASPMSETLAVDA